MSEYKPISFDALEAIRQLKPVQYKDKYNFPRLHIGTSDLKKVLPHALVDYGSEQVIDWSAITVVALQAISDLADRVAKLEANQPPV